LPVNLKLFGLKRTTRQVDWRELVIDFPTAKAHFLVGLLYRFSVPRTWEICFNHTATEILISPLIMQWSFVIFLTGGMALCSDTALI
jgi:hypothetical protein